MMEVEARPHNHSVLSGFPFQRALTVFLSFNNSSILMDETLQRWFFSEPV